MAGFRWVEVLLMTCVAAQPAMVRDLWIDSTGASSSVGNVITCTWGVTCRHGFSRIGPDEICESSFECSPPQPMVAPVEPAQVPQVSPVEPGPALPSPPSPQGTGNITGPPVGGAKPESHASSSSNSSNLTAAPTPSAPAANGTDIPHIPHMPDMPQVNQVSHNTSELSNTSVSNTSADAVPAEPVQNGRDRRRLWYSKASKVESGGAEGPEGQRRLNSRSHGNQIRCECGVVCQSGSHMEGGTNICNGPLYCESCMSLDINSGSIGGV